MYGPELRFSHKEQTDYTYEDMEIHVNQVVFLGCITQTQPKPGHLNQENEGFALDVALTVQEPYCSEMALSLISLRFRLRRLLPCRCGK